MKRFFTNPKFCGLLATASAFSTMVARADDASTDGITTALTAAATAGTAILAIVVTATTVKLVRRLLAKVA